MPSRRLSYAEAAQAVELVNEAVRDGYVIDGKPSAVEEAARRALHRGIIGGIKTFRNRLRRAGEYYGMNPGGVIPDPPEVDESDLRWSSLSDAGWVRHDNQDVEEIRTFVRGGHEEERSVKIFDPGAMYPIDWVGPRLSDKRKFRTRNPDGVRRWILTSAQDRTPVHGPFMVNLDAYAAFVGAEIIVGGFTYAKDWFEAIFGGGGRDKRRDAVDVLPYSSAIRERVVATRRDLGGVWYCAEVNILPTAERPLSGLLTYARGRSAVFSHTKHQLESVPRAQDRDPVVAMTTGACTVPNYVPRKAGFKAEFHHIHGAVIVEHDADGVVFMRHIHADANTGAFQDLDIKVDMGVVTTGNRVRAIIYGDAHVRRLDPLVASATWGICGGSDDDSLRDALRPEHEFIHDVTDFYSRSHHNRHDPWHMIEVARDGITVEGEVKEVADFLEKLRRPDSEIHVVESNHDLALARWLREADWRNDPINAEYHLRLNSEMVQRINAGEDASIFEIASRAASDDGLDGIHFIRDDEGFEVDGVECGWHGHNGPNGAKGTTQALLRVASKIHKAHDHTPTTRDGVKSAGTSQYIRPMPKWAKGPTTWANSHIVQYERGAAAHIIIVRGRWRALGRPRSAEMNEPPRMRVRVKARRAAA